MCRIATWAPLKDSDDLTRWSPETNIDGSEVLAMDALSYAHAHSRINVLSLWRMRSLDYSVFLRLPKVNKVIGPLLSPSLHSLQLNAKEKPF